MTTSKHKKILVNGLLIISTVVGMTVRDISGKAIANLEYNKVIHHNPTFLNDTLYAETTVISKKLSKNKKNGVVHVKTKSFNQQHMFFTVVSPLCQLGLDRFSCVERNDHLWVSTFVGLLPFPWKV